LEKPRKSIKKILEIKDYTFYTAANFCGDNSMANPISAMFGRSPIRPIQGHMAKAQKCVILLGDFLEASFANDWIKAESLQQAIRASENDADDLKSNVRNNLPKNLFLPVPRSDLLVLLSTQDRLANRAKDIAGLMLGRKMIIPESLVAPVREYYRESLAASEQALKVIQELDELLETGFRGKEVELVEGLILELDELEHRSDVSQIELRAKLFELEESLPPVHVMFLYRIIDLIGDLADISQKIGSRLLLLIAQ
tara:strand:+ start:3917 stop:4681 length:765 start_codon:yes stop_codon:yes gene_type:complete